MALTAKEKRHAVRQARKWLQFKLRMESPFKRELRTYFNQQYKRAQRGLPPETIGPVLQKQYDRVIKQIRRADIKQTEDDFNIEEALALLILGHSTSQSVFIDKTTNKYLSRALEMAKAELAEGGNLFPALSTLNRTAAGIFRQMNRGRIGGIGVTETQWVTESSKEIINNIADDMMAEAIVEGDTALAQAAADMSGSLTHAQIADDIGEVPQGDLFAAMNAMTKTWITMGDSKVRPWHDDALFQTVPINEPFLVMGELLMYPGDTSLGATPRNVANCRCSSQRL